MDFYEISLNFPFVGLLLLFLTFKRSLWKFSNFSKYFEISNKFLIFFIFKIFFSIFKVGKQFILRVLMWPHGHVALQGSAK